MWWIWFYNFYRTFPILSMKRTYSPINFFFFYVYIYFFLLIMHDLCQIIHLFVFLFSSVPLSLTHHEFIKFMTNMYNLCFLNSEMEWYDRYYTCTDLTIKWNIDLAIYWFINLLIYQFTDLSIYLFINLLIYQFTDLSISWFINLLIYQFTDLSIYSLYINLQIWCYCNFVNTEK